MEFTLCFYFGILLLFCGETLYCAEGNTTYRRRQRRFVPSSTTNNSISTLLANATSVYCSNNWDLEKGMGAMVAFSTLFPSQTTIRLGTPLAMTGRPVSTTAKYFAGLVPTAANVPPVVTLNDSQMHEMFEHKGGNYLRDYMATTQEEAEKHFPNLLLMTAPVKVKGSDSVLTIHDNYVAQQTIIDDLNKLHVYASSTDISVLPETGHQYAKHTSTVRKTTSEFPSSISPILVSSTSVSGATLHWNANKDVQQASPTVVDTSMKFRSDTMNVPTNSLLDYLTGSKNIERLMQTTQQTGTSPRNPSGTNNSGSSLSSTPTEQTPKISNFENNMLDWNYLWNEANTTVHPETLLELERGNKRQKRQADGSVCMEQYCQLKGSKTQDGYLHMCSTCAVITKLPDHYFPRFINEAVCKTGDSNCFVINGLPHGECRQRTITLNIMRKKPNKCLLMVHNGENIMIDDWELYPKTIRVSCECLIKKNSFLAPYVKGRVPHN